MIVWTMVKLTLPSFPYLHLSPFFRKQMLKLEDKTISCNSTYSDQSLELSSLLYASLRTLFFFFCNPSISTKKHVSQPQATHRPSQPLDKSGPKSRWILDTPTTRAATSALAPIPSRAARLWHLWISPMGEIQRGTGRWGKMMWRNPDCFEVFLAIFGPLGCSGRCCTCDGGCSEMGRNGRKWALGDVSSSDSHQVSLARLAPMFAMLGDSLMIPDVGI